MATMTTVQESFAGVGRVHARRYSTVDPWRYVGNVSLLTIKQELDIQEQRDYTRLGGGVAKRRVRLKAMNADSTWLNIDLENLKLAVAGTSAHTAAAAVTGESAVATKGSLVALAHPPSDIDVVKDVSGTTTYTAGTDYVMSVAGLMIPDASTIAAPTGTPPTANIKVDYHHGAYDRVEAGTATTTELQLLFEGLNDAEHGEPFLVDVWRASVPPAAELALIGEQMVELKFAIALLKDDTRGTGTSGFFRATKTPITAA